MLELLRILVDEVNERSHLTPLLHKTISVQLIADEEQAILQIEDGVLRIYEDERNAANVFIMGKKQVMEAIITGNLKLRKAIAAQEVDWQGSLRTALLLESLFRLAIPNYIEKRPKAFK
ncbi:hypothetical protein J27TS8_21030 [Robertmurraya siralis]|uniref:SCP2 domain-containing protein n=1 Tax=Robertmurraya siralis TaxID=77777 RepID=A0A919WHM8_9BACI|nr:SCP2 sterol-binding domain-containing protein [Robertmurraya siralis]GIN62110.1 hypothetical protein J27TS8_21030 [Robertmurraya siralis]